MVEVIALIILLSVALMFAWRDGKKSGEITAKQEFINDLENAKNARDSLNNSDVVAKLHEKYKR